MKLAILLVLFSCSLAFANNGEDDLPHCNDDITEAIIGTPCGCNDSYEDFINFPNGNSACLPKCRNGLVRYKTTCVTPCRENYERDQNGTCQSLDGGFALKCTPGLELVEGICLIPCQSGHIRDGQSCRKLCNPQMYDEFNARCVRKCPSYKVRNEQGRCVIPKIDPNENKSQCNKITSEVVDGKCIPKCSPMQERVEGTCMQKCNPSQERVGKQCRTYCPPNYKRNARGDCAFCKS